MERAVAVVVRVVGSGWGLGERKGEISMEGKGEGVGGEGIVGCWWIRRWGGVRGGFVG